MFKYITLLLHLIRILLLLAKPKGTKAIIAEHLILRKQLIVLSRKYKRAPNLSFGFERRCSEAKIRKSHQFDHQN